MDRILIIMKKNNGHQGIIFPFTGAFFHKMQTCLLVYTYNRSQVSVYRTIGPLVLSKQHIHFHMFTEFCALSFPGCRVRSPGDPDQLPPEVNRCPSQRDSRPSTVVAPTADRAGPTEQG